MTEEVQGNETKSVPPIASLPINQLCLDYLNSDAGHAMVQKHIENAVIRAVDEATSSYSPFMKQLEAALEKVMKVGGELDYASYGDAIRQIIEVQLASVSRETVQTKVAARIKELLEPPPAEIKLSQLVEMFVEELREKNADEHCHCGYGPMRASFVVEHPKGSQIQGFIDIGFDEGHDKKKVQDCQIRMTYFVTKQEIFRLRFGRIERELQLFTGPLYGFERALFHMKACGTKLIFDESEAEDISLDYGPDND